MPKKSNVETLPSDDSIGDIGSAIGALASATSSIADELQPFYQLEDLVHQLRHLSDIEGVADAIKYLSDVTALSTIARHGTDKDRAAVVAKLKRSFNDLD